MFYISVSISVWNFILLFTEDDSALKVAQQITFRGLVAYKRAAYKKRCTKNITYSLKKHVFLKRKFDFYYSSWMYLICFF